jgi:hypothetical protein
MKLKFYRYPEFYRKAEGGGRGIWNYSTSVPFDIRPSIHRLQVEVWPLIDSKQELTHTFEREQ